MTGNDESGSLIWKMEELLIMGLRVREKNHIDLHVNRHKIAEYFRWINHFSNNKVKKLI
jgi:hypothetical protein